MNCYRRSTDSYLELPRNVAGFKAHVPWLGCMFRKAFVFPGSHRRCRRRQKLKLVIRRFLNLNSVFGAALGLLGKRTVHCKDERRNFH
jgi:hypothetical protein